MVAIKTYVQCLYRFNLHMPLSYDDEEGKWNDMRKMRLIACAIMFSQNHTLDRTTIHSFLLE